MDILIEIERGELCSVLDVIDEALRPLLAMISWNEGARDSAEHLVGVGFVACQKFIAAISAGLKIKKSDALDLGPVHDGGATVISIVNAAANAWKHGDDWFEEEHQANVRGSAEPKNKRKDRALDVLDTVVSDRSWEYPLSRTLVSLGGKVSFLSLLPLLEEWVEAASRAAP